MKRTLIAAASLLAILAATEAQAKGGHHRHAAGPVVHALSGTATYYGGSDGLCGHHVSSGGVLNCKKLVAAHRTLPFGTILNVKNPKTGRNVTVEVIDRGPFTGAFIDLSPEAAKQLGGLSTHYGLVAEVVSMGNGTVSAENATRGTTSVAKAKTQGPLQLASFMNFGGTDDVMRPASMFGATQASIVKQPKRRR